MSELIAYQDNEKIVLIDGTTIEIDTGMLNDPLGFIVTEIAKQTEEPKPACPNCGAVLRIGDAWWNECGKCHAKITNI